MENICVHTILSSFVRNWAKKRTDEYLMDIHSGFTQGKLYSSCKLSDHKLFSFAVAFTSKIEHNTDVIIWKWRSNATGFIDWMEIWRKLLHQMLIEDGCNRNWLSYGEIITPPLILVTVKEGSRKKEWVNENINGFFRLFCLENVNISGILLPFFSGQKVRFRKAHVDIERANCLISHPPHLQPL